MTNDTSTRKANVENWRRGYEAALSGKALVCISDEKTSAWRLGYRDGRALRLKLLVERVFRFRRLAALVVRSAKGERQLVDLLRLAETSDAAAFFAYLQFQALPIEVRRRVWKAFARAQRPAKSKVAPGASSPPIGEGSERR